MLAETQSSSFLHHNRRVKSLPAVTVHHVTTATDMNAPVLIPWGVQRVQLVTVVEHLPAGSRQHGRALHERGHNDGSSITVDLPKQIQLSICITAAILVLRNNQVFFLAPQKNFISWEHLFHCRRDNTGRLSLVRTVFCDIAKPGKLIL